jgi:CcmD family protein
MEHFAYLFAAYSIIFLAIFLYALFIWQRQSRLEAELRAMEIRLKSLAGVPKQAPTAEEPTSRSAR